MLSSALQRFLSVPQPSQTTTTTAIAAAAAPTITSPHKHDPPNNTMHA